MIDFTRGYSEIEAVLGEVPIPRGMRIAYDQPTPPSINDVGAAVRDALRTVELPRGSVAIGVGSRGVAAIAEIVATLVAALKSAGAKPFIVPAMGSHGASTADGQAEVLAHLGVTEERVGAPIRATMETVDIGTTEDGVTVAMDANAYAADAIIVVNRVKPHTAFRGPIESGPTKMLAIGLGKRRGAHSIHAHGWGRIHETIPAAARIAIASGKVAFALATLENAHEAPCRIVAIPANALLAREPALQEEAKRLLPRLPFPEIDVLVIDRIGKNISGDGMDPNVTGRYPTAYAIGGPAIGRIVVLDLTDETGGNANGVGLADVITARLASRMIPAATYVNALTSTTPEPVRIPMTLPSAELALAAGLIMCQGVSAATARIVRIHDTLHLREMWVSESLRAHVDAHPHLTVTGAAETFPLSSADASFALHAG